jgi:orotidine-5'-phosphate decarboxylase
MTSSRDKVLVALDVNSLAAAQSIVRELRPLIGCFKVGLELLTAVGAPQIVEVLKAEGASVFFDGKFNDIPNTVGQASRQVSSMGVKMFDVHASTGELALRAAAENKGSSLLLVVTVLTSFDEETSKSVFGESAGQKVPQFAQMAKNCGADGIVCSPQELTLLAQYPALTNLLKVTPGVRPSWAGSDDQKRSLTPGQAIKMGADYLVIGRPITKPPKEIGSPLEAAKRILSEIDEAVEAQK